MTQSRLSRTGSKTRLLLMRGKTCLPTWGASPRPYGACSPSDMKVKLAPPKWGLSSPYLRNIFHLSTWIIGVHSGGGGEMTTRMMTMLTPLIPFPRIRCRQLQRQVKDVDSALAISVDSNDNDKGRTEAWVRAAAATAS